MFPEENLLVVVSALGKTTNALEQLVEAKYYGKDTVHQALEQVIRYHDGIFRDLFPSTVHPAHQAMSKLIGEMKSDLAREMPSQFAEFYDRIIGYGELLSSWAVHYILDDAGLKNHWFDVREVLKTDASFREASIDWKTSQDNCDKVIKTLFKARDRQVVVTQGFIGSDVAGRPTSLGREGSDYTASIFASLLDAGRVIFWKDVPGILNADPKHFPQTIKLEEISYAEATELAFYGAKVIHPKTIKPLQNKNIPLEVRSFIHPSEPGTLIHADAISDRYIPSFIFKFDQALISISHRDHSFVNERMFHDVFGLLSMHAIHLNMIQNSALTLTICIDLHQQLEKIIAALQNNYQVKYNEGLELVTIRHFNEKAAEAVLQDREILLEQQNRTVVQYVIR